MKEDEIVIEPFTPEHAAYFRTLNEEWLEKYFHIEPHDVEVLSDAENQIIKPGGEIFFAKLNGKVVGTCALMKHSEQLYELAKMAVTETAQGRGIGKNLALAVIEDAKRKGAKTVFLESNTKLNPAISLYRSIGFIEAEFPIPSVYERANIFMRLELTE